jgi:hypothetical protein
MEEASVDTIDFLVRSVWPIGLIAIGLGILTVGFAGFATSRAKSADGEIGLPPSSMGERIIVGLCAAASSLGLVVAVQIIRLSRVSLPRFPVLGVLLAVSLLLLALPAVLWETRFRWVAEGFALVALGTTAILGMWSIGFLFLPLLVPMAWVCIQHLRQMSKSLSPLHLPQKHPYNPSS